MKKSILKLMGITLLAALASLQLCAQEDIGAESEGPQAKKEMKKRPQKKNGMGKENSERGERPAPFLSSLSDEEKGKLEKLRKENLEAFKQEIQKLMREKREKKMQENAKLQETVRKYREAKTDEEKQQALAELKTETEKEFNSKMEMNRKSIEQTEKRLQEFKKKYEERIQKSSAIIDERVKEITKDPSLNWDRHGN
ncbi:MAG: hypothetical protein A2020_04075 [Lentisphaerae bacterium GWF2_45_14]|nr:MAG: hypothetical protein A2020_04075 [Lentisphaerae bacterium GWF2_45_14]